MTRLPAPIVVNANQRQAIRKMEMDYAQAGRHRWANQCKAILLLADGYNMGETSDILNRPYSTVQQWSRRFRRNSMDSLVPKTSKRGSKKKLGVHERLLLSKAIVRGPRIAGYPGSVWTSIIVGDYIFKRWKVKYHPGHVRRLLHELGFSVQFPKKRLALADPEAQEKWLKETYPDIKKKHC